MNEVKKTTIRLTIIYSIVFFGFIWIFSGGIYLWTNNALGKGYVNRINEIVEQSNNKAKVSGEFSDDTATVAADVALDRMRNIILLVNGVALILIPTLAYQLSRRSLRPLIQSQAEQQKFITNASHELRTPLAVMAGELELAAKQPRSINEYQKTIKNTAREVHRMTVLVQELLLLARIGTIDGLKDKASIEITDLIDEVVNLHSAQAKQKNITIIQSHKAQGGVSGRRELLIIAVGNLVDNAIKFSKKSSSIFIDTSSDKNVCTIEVKNGGSTIPVHKIPHLFERFYQTNTDHSLEGYGLGLAITKQIVELHAGSIAATSSNKETTFSISLPIKK
ncbi:MAG: hypothetical protein JWN12_303 [Candidatus Saccharibacteria bacterium]|nr:hypothetical protein [Candidatus Saccharibacteria bacterium]